MKTYLAAIILALTFATAAHSVQIPAGCVVQSFVCAPTPAPSAPIAPVTVAGTTPLPWNPTLNSRTLVMNCNPAGDTRTFSFTVPANAVSPHAITGSDYSDSVGNFRSYILREVPSGAIIATGKSTAITLNFSFDSRRGYVVIKRGQTYTLEVVSDPTAPYKCNYFIDLDYSG